MANIWHAAFLGELGEVERIVGDDPSRLDVQAADGWTPLMAASARGHVRVVRWLLDQGAAIDERDNDRCTALSLAILRGHPHTAELLLERGADPTIGDNRDTTPLLMASEWGYTEVVRRILAHPYAVAIMNNRLGWGRTALWYASWRGHLEIVRLLLKQGADPTVGDNSGTTPMAAARGALSMPYSEDEHQGECIKALKVRTPSVSLLGLTLANRKAFAGNVLNRAGRRRSGPTSCGRPGRWRMRLAASPQSRWWRRGREATSSTGAWRQCGGRGRGGAAGCDGGGGGWGGGKRGEEDEGGAAGACRAVTEAGGVRGADGDDGVTLDPEGGVNVMWLAENLFCCG
jgi:hypothetical protein